MGLSIFGRAIGRATTQDEYSYTQFEYTYTHCKSATSDARCGFQRWSRQKCPTATRTAFSRRVEVLSGAGSETTAVGLCGWMIATASSQKAPKGAGKGAAALGAGALGGLEPVRAAGRHHMRTRHAAAARPRLRWDEWLSCGKAHRRRCARERLEPLPTAQESIACAKIALPLLTYGISSALAQFAHPRRQLHRHERGSKLSQILYSRSLLRKAHGWPRMHVGIGGGSRWVARVGWVPGRVARTRTAHASMFG